MHSLIEKLKKVNDFRKNKGKRHELWLILLLVILGIMQGYIGYRAIGDFVKANQQSIINTFNISADRVPSYSTIRRVMMGVNWSNLLLIFNQWAGQSPEAAQEEDWIAIDGKSLNNTVKNYNNSEQNFVVILSAYSLSNGVVLKKGRWENRKSSEIKQVQDLVRNCNFKNKVFTLDALHCQKETTSSIIASGNHYLIAVKENQKKMFQKIKDVTNQQEPLSTHISEDKSHGRSIKRQVSVFKNFNYFDSSWTKITSIIKVERQGNRGNKNYYNVAYYLSSLSRNAEVFSQKIRGHWLIENQLHWVKDVIFKEDTLPIHDFQAATNFSILQTIALNLFRILGFLSITEGQRWLGNRWSRLWVLLK